MRLFSLHSMDSYMMFASARFKMHAATERKGVDVCLAGSDQKTASKCPHGPMLLFERFYKDDRAPQRFYACSACRDRKNCQFFQWEHESVSKIRSKTHKEMTKALRLPYLQATKCLEKLESSLDEKEARQLCQTCSMLLLPAETKEHQGHRLMELKGDDKRRPSNFSMLVEQQKTQAQYLFSLKTTQFLVHTLRRLKLNKVICLGTPRIHEEIMVSNQQTGDKQKLKTLLLDIDYRYAQFFPPSQFCWYNMFNHFFFDRPDGEKVLRDFLCQAPGEQVVLLMDPPFGGLVEVLAVTVKRIWDTWKDVNKGCEEELPTMWIFPHFMESHITSALPSLIMQDYKVEYGNHAHFTDKQSSGNSRGSPVRIFTNIRPADIVLPRAEGYRFCRLCQRFVSSENVHCRKCSGCMSKDGRSYVHCDDCGTCVKPGRQHCAKCQRCELPQHDCSKPRGSGCHICGELGHKRRDCPKRNPVTPRDRRTRRKRGRSRKGSLSHSSEPAQSLKRRRSSTGR